jgi:hypothetical protein
VGARATIAVVAAVAIFIGAPTAAGPPKARAQGGGIEFAPATPLVLDAKKLSAGEAVEVRNATGSGVDISFVLTPFSRDGARLDASAVATLNPESARVLAGESVKVTVKRAPDATLAAGTYKGALLATSTTPALFARRALEITIGAEEAGAEPEPLVDTVTATVYRNRWGGWGRYLSPNEIVIPLKTTELRLAVTRDTEFGGLHRGTDAAAVRADGPNTVELPSGRGLGIHLTRLGETGDYEGKIDLLPNDEDAGDVTLKVTYKDTIWWPLLVLVFGVGTGTLVSRLLGVSLRYYGLRADLGLLRRAISDAIVSFGGKAPADKDWRKYDIAAAGQAKADELKTRVDDLRGEYMTKIPDEAIKELRDAIKTARTSASGFATFADELTALDTQVDAIKNPRGPLPAPQPGSGTPLPARPLVLDEVEPLLIGRAFAGLDELDLCREQVRNAADAAKKWLVVRAEISRRQQTLADIANAGIPPGKEQAYETAQVAVLGAYSALLTDVDVARARADWLRGDLEHVRDLVDDLYQAAHVAGREILVPPPVGVDVGAAIPERGGGLAPPARSRSLSLNLDLVAWIRSLPWLRDLDDYKFFTLLRRVQSIVLVLLAFAVAVATGLNSLYVGKAFGTWWDYINLFMWGVTTKIVFDLVVGSLDTLGLLRLARR